ncbi:hypothetical protein [Actinacidiphila sp. bgisy145]|uniref:hypothetical protein n=1 Tax=Actinacidiphila sp. bgisy145 TaxID=3413792 RepID=UPI003EB7AFCA
MGTLLHPPAEWELTEAQHAALQLRTLLRALGAPEDRVQRVTPMGSLAGDDYVYMPPLPMEVVQHLVRLLPAPPEAEPHR